MNFIVCCSALHLLTDGIKNEIIFSIFGQIFNKKNLIHRIGIEFQILLNKFIYKSLRRNNIQNDSFEAGEAVVEIGIGDGVPAIKLAAAACLASISPPA